MIDIIIPAYNAHKTIERTLASIAYQKDAQELKVYIVNDASSENYSNEISFFKNFLDIKELKMNKNGGPGVARQYGIDHSNSEYIVFIDADDVFSSPHSVDTLYRNIKESNADVVVSSFYETLKDGSKKEYIEDRVWLHGKIYRRKFLEDNNIRFNNTRANEDNGFNQLIFLHDSKVEFIEDITYIWEYNETSITRLNDFEYTFGGLEGYIYNITWALEIAIKDNCDYNKIAELAYYTLIALYYYYIEFIDEKEVDVLIKKSKRLYEIYLEYNLDKNREFEIWEEQYYISTQDMNIKQRLNPPISLEEFFYKLENSDINNEKNMVVAMCCTETWYSHLIVGLYSLLENTKSIKKIYLLLETDNVYDVPYLDYLIKKYNVEFKLIKVNKLIEKKLKRNCPNKNSYFTDFTFGKLLLSDIVEESKVLYLDTDAIAVKDISDIWNYDISDYYIAGVKDWGVEERGNIEELGINGKYINAGVVLFNLDKMRKDKIEKKCFELINKIELIFPDQDALNYVCTNKELYLSSMYNVCDDVTIDIENRNLAKIYHFAGIKENWVVNLRYAEEWYSVEERFNKDIKKYVDN